MDMDDPDSVDSLKVRSSLHPGGVHYIYIMGDSVKDAILTNANNVEDFTDILDHFISSTPCWHSDVS
jgi:hypothetical protein